MSTQENEIMKPDLEQGATLAIYGEICKSYHAIDDFRMKLLGLLPLASLVSVLFVDRTKLAEGAHELVGFASIFAALLTIALFLYEIRGIQRTHNLVTEGRHLEERLGLGHGHFYLCEKEHREAPLRGLNAKFIACAIYSLVFSEWFFVALRFGFGSETRTCVLWAAGTGIALALITYALVRKLTPA